MDQKDFLIRLVLLVAVFAGLAAAAHLILGAHQFSLYGVAIAGLLVLPWLASALWRRSSHKGVQKWPIILLIIGLAVVALGQIGYWLAFFHGGEDAIGLGIARQMISAAIAEYALPIWGLLTVVLLWIIGRLMT